ncbi:hypothetical protein M7I_1601 [Glarea lozoyensis 74030]|uniref:Uncharacterized protein n=1 Tax=Glarea lozoyensis (strain ATCC 74030 / MF5533) TaxID=1104152 RepID=H0EGI5_GLAL7|nr:hypothetical protein M7I_1601 [Glarea lozoyensis 74030]
MAGLRDASSEKFNILQSLLRLKSSRDSSSWHVRDFVGAIQRA